MKNFMRKTALLMTLLYLCSCGQKPEELVTPEPVQAPQPQEPVKKHPTQEPQTEIPKVPPPEKTVPAATTPVTPATTVTAIPDSTLPEIAAVLDTATAAGKQPAPAPLPQQPAVPESDTVAAALPQVAKQMERPAPAPTIEVQVAPPVPEPEVTLPDSAFKEYMIKRNDWLSKIAQKEYGDWRMWRKIYQWNPAEIGPDPNLIYPYRFLGLLKPRREVKPCPPEFKPYEIKKGETLWSIAKRIYGDELAWVIIYTDNRPRIEANQGVASPGMQIRLRVVLNPCE